MIDASTAIELVAKATLLLTVAALASLLLRRASAAILHLLWSTVIVCVLFLPIAMVSIPPVPVQATPPVSHSAVVIIASQPVSAPKPHPAQLTWVQVVAGVWITGFALFSLRVIRALWQVRLMTRRANPIERGKLSLLSRPIRARFLITPQIAVPITWGVWRPVILLPAAALEWPPDQLRSAVLHEVAHVERHDWLFQMIAAANCCLYWFHPLAWFAASRLADAAERAGDDRVLRLGTSAADYATHLVQVATSLRRIPAALGMGHVSGLQARVSALLDSQRDRRSPGRVLPVLSTTFAMMLLVAIASLQVTAQVQGSGTLSGSVHDVSGATIPGAMVSAENLDASNREAATTDQEGRFQVVGLPSGRYRLTIEKPGFAPFRSRILMVTAGADIRSDSTLNVGSVSEKIQVSAKRPQTGVPVGRAPQRIRVGGNVQATKLINMVKPSYPAAAQSAGVEGTVVLQAIIGVDGAPLSVTVVSQAAPEELVQAAVDAVRQWRYEPTRLNGVPVEVVTTVTVSFQLEP